MATQKARLLHYLKTGLSITPKEAREKIYLHVLAQRIADLKADGYPIKSEWYETSGGSRVKRYWMATSFFNEMQGASTGLQ